jgi:protein-export membrane protein SecD
MRIKLKTAPVGLCLAAFWRFFEKTMKKNVFADFFKPSARGQVWRVFIIIVVLALAAFLVAGGSYYNRFSDKVATATHNWVRFPKESKPLAFRLGLDLQGGSQLIYQADVSKVAEADRMTSLGGVRDVIERRVNSFGVSEPVIQVNKTMNGDYRIIAELAGIKDVKEAIKMIGETPLLEFKEQASSSTTSLSADEKAKLDSYNAQNQTKAVQVLTDALAGKDFATLAKANNMPLSAAAKDAPAKENDGDLGWIPGTSTSTDLAIVKSYKVGEVSPKLVAGPSSLTIYKLVDKRLMTDPFTNKTGSVQEYRVSKIEFPVLSADMLAAAMSQTQWQNTELSGKYLKRSVVQFNPNDGTPEVSLEFNDEGAKLFEEITGRNVGKPVAIFLDNYMISSPTVNEKISGGKAVINGNFSLTEVKLLVQRLNTGALPVPITLVSQQTVGASLGQQSVSDTVKAGIIGLILVALFMIFFYRLPGLLSVFALLLYGLISLALFKLFGITMTLAGVAGFILSIGMAVDANILIFERMKEELRHGKALNIAMSDGFRRAWPSIRDSNLTTLIVCMVLIEFSTSIIKGFAVTLALGVLISMFTAIFVTRNFLSLMNNRWLEKYHWLITSVKNTKEKK